MKAISDIINFVCKGERHNMRGLLPICKEKGMTSHDVVLRLRKILKMKKIGHTGTLDPDVDGVLLVCLGEGTKLVELLMDGQKEYQGSITLGYSTETEDASGEKVSTTPVLTPVNIDLIDQKMAEMEGVINQVPPYYSAVKVNGRKLYEYARAGEIVERPVRQVQIDSFIRTSEPVYNESQQTQTWDFHVVCGKGTYVRTLAVDLGEKLGFASHMSRLTRNATGGFNQQQALTLDQVQVAVEQGTINEAIRPIESALTEFPSIILTESQYHDVQHGKLLPHDYFNSLVSEQTVLFYQGLARAIYQPHPLKPNLLKPLRMFVENE